MVASGDILATMHGSIGRRGFIAAGAAALAGPRAAGKGEVARRPGTHVRIGLNAYSFNAPLRAGKMTLEDAVDYCAQHGLETLDATGYYFPGYPQVPADDVIYRLKRRAFVNGIAISGTGV